MAQFHLNVVEVFLAAVVEDDQARRKADRLPAQLGTDRSPGAGDEDGLAGKIGPDFFLVESDLLTPQQILIPDLPDVLDRYPAVDQFAKRREHLERDLRVPAQGGEAPHLRTVAGNHGHQHFLGPGPAGMLLEVVDQPDHRDPVQSHADLGRVVIDKPNGGVGNCRIVVHFPENLFGGISRADQKQPLFFNWFLAGDQTAHAFAFLIKIANGYPVERDEPEGKEKIEEENRPGKPGEAVAEEQQADDGQGGQQGNQEDIDDVLQTGVAPHPSIEAASVKKGDLHRQKQREYPQKLTKLWLLQVRFKTNHIGQQVRQNDRQDIAPQNQPKLGVFHQILEQTHLGGYFVEIY